MPSSNPEWADQRALVLLGHIILGSHFNKHSGYSAESALRT
jgi:hypothetical protein